MIIPDCFNTSLTDAEKAAFEILLTATNSQNNKHGFLGYQPSIANTWFFEATKVSETETLLFRENESLVFKCDAECSFLNRADCQRWFMAIVAALPIRQHEDSNIVHFRVFQDSEITSEYLKLPNEKNEVKIFSKSVEFDLEFATGGKSSAF